MTEPYDVPLRRSQEQEPEDVPSDGLSFDHRDLPTATAPSFDLSIFDDVPLDEDGLPELPDDFDRSRLPGFEEPS